MKKKALIIVGIVLILIIASIAVILSKNTSSDNDYIFTDMNKVKSIKMVYQKEVEQGNKLAKMFQNLPSKDLKRYTFQTSDSATGRQDYVVKFYDRFDKEIYHIQYYPEKEEELVILVIKNSQKSNEKREYYKLENQKIIKYLKTLENKVQ